MNMNDPLHTIRDPAWIAYFDAHAPEVEDIDAVPVEYETALALLEIPQSAWARFRKRGAQYREQLAKRSDLDSGEREFLQKASQETGPGMSDILLGLVGGDIDDARYYYACLVWKLQLLMTDPDTPAIN